MAAVAVAFTSPLISNRTGTCRVAELARTRALIFPVAALTSLPNGDGTLARYEWGGWLIWRAPQTPVFVDGRLTPYTNGVLEDYKLIITAAPGWQDALARRRVHTLLVSPSDPVAVRATD